LTVNPFPDNGIGVTEDFLEHTVLWKSRDERRVRVGTNRRTPAKPLNHLTALDDLDEDVRD
jgi:hypothetical protein